MTKLREPTNIRMAEVCAVCGLPKDLCVCSTISMEQQRVKVRLETRKWGKNLTVVEGVDARSVNLGELASKMKAVCACGGTVKDNVVMLQGDHRDKVKKLLLDYGFPPSSIEVH